MNSLNAIMQSLKLTPSPSRSPEPEPEVTLQNLPNYIKPPFTQIEHFPGIDILQRNYLDLLPRVENTNALTNADNRPRSSLVEPTNVQRLSPSTGAKSGPNRYVDAQRLQDLEGTNRRAMLSEQRTQESLVTISRLTERTKKFTQTATDILDEHRSERNLASGSRNAEKAPDRLSSFTLPEYQDDVDAIKHNLRIFFEHIAYPSASAEQLIALVHGHDVFHDFSEVLEEIHALGLRPYECTFEGFVNTIHELLTGLPRYEFRNPPVEANPWHFGSPATLANSPSTISTISTLTEAPVSLVPSPPSVLPSATPMTTFSVPSNAPALVPLVYSTNSIAAVAIPSSPPTASAVQYAPSAPPAPVPAAVMYSPWGVSPPSPNAALALPSGLGRQSPSASTFNPGVLPATSTSALTSTGASSPPGWPETPSTPLRPPVIKYEMMSRMSRTPSSASRSSSTSPSSVLSRLEPLREQISTRGNPDFKTFMFTSSLSVQVTEPPNLKPTQVAQLGDLLFNKCPSANASFAQAQVWIYVNTNVSNDGVSVPGWMDITEVYGSLDLADLIKHPRDQAKYLTKNVNTGRPGWVTLDTIKKHIKEAQLNSL